MAWVDRAFQHFYPYHRTGNIDTTFRVLYKVSYIGSKGFCLRTLVHIEATANKLNNLVIGKSKFLVIILT